MVRVNVRDFDLEVRFWSCGLVLNCGSTPRSEGGGFGLGLGWSWGGVSAGGCAGGGGLWLGSVRRVLEGHVGGRGWLCRDCEERC